MRVRLIKRRTIEVFAMKHAKSRNAFRLWLAVLQQADWNVPADMAATYPSADLLGRGSERVVFDIAGNAFRMICSYHFGKQFVHLFVKWIGTHAEYNRICKEGKQYTIDQF